MENERRGAEDFALRAYKEMKLNRAYARTTQTVTTLGVLWRAMAQRRAAEGRNPPDAVPSPWQEIFGINEKLNTSRCKLFEQTPGDEEAFAKTWTQSNNGQNTPH